MRSVFLVVDEIDWSHVLFMNASCRCYWRIVEKHENDERVDAVDGRIRATVCMWLFRTRRCRVG